jgi:RND family efflux transporter MFP subunit
VAFLVVVVALGVLVHNRLTEEDHRPARRARRESVAVAQVQTGSIELRRTFSGTLEASASFVVAPKVSGRVERMHVDFSDTVTRDQVVAELDRAEYVQEHLRAKAALAAARAKVKSAEWALSTADRDLARVGALRKRSISSEAELDTVKAEQLARVAEREAAKAEVELAQANLEAARIRLGYTRITASWAEGSDERVVAERFVDDGDTVAANAPLLSIVQIQPLNAVIYVTEGDYGRIAVGQTVELGTDAYPGEMFRGTIRRISSVFRQASRQAKVELRVPNEDRRLKPGMFVRATVVLEHLDNVKIVPRQAVTKRNNEDGVFVVDEGKKTVSWLPVTVGITSGDRTQVIAEDLAGRVVTGGRQNIKDGSAVSIPDDEAPGPEAHDQP